MAVYSPVPPYADIPPLSAADSPSYLSPPSSSPASPPAHLCPSPRHVSRSERMLLDTLRRADLQSQKGPDADADYFTRAMDGAWSRSQSVNASPSRSYKRLSPQSFLSPPHLAERCPSPSTIRGVDRDAARHERRTPSPSPHPYHRSSSPRSGAHAPSFSRTQTAPSRSQLGTSRPSTPSAQYQTRPTSPVRRRPSTHNAPGAAASSASPSPAAKRAAQHEEILRSRLESVLARQQAQEAAMEAGTASTTGTRSRGPSFSRTAPPAGAAYAATASSTVTGDHWTWTQNPTTTSVPAVHLAAATPPSPNASRRSPSVSRPPRTTSSSALSSLMSPSRIKEGVMLTPPPSPPASSAQKLEAPTNSATGSSNSSASVSRAPSQNRHNLGMGHPSRASSVSARTTPPPPFDARSASLALKEQRGYVSFCEVAGLGEPEGMDGEDSDCEQEEARGRTGKWWEVWRK